MKISHKKYWQEGRLYYGEMTIDGETFRDLVIADGPTPYCTQRVNDHILDQYRRKKEGRKPARLSR